MTMTRRWFARLSGKDSEDKNMKISIFGFTFFTPDWIDKKSHEVFEAIKNKPDVPDDHKDALAKGSELLRRSIIGFKNVGALPVGHSEDSLSLAQVFISMYPYGFKEPKSPAVKIAMEIAMREAGY